MYRSLIDFVVDIDNRTGVEKSQLRQTRVKQSTKKKLGA